MYKIMPIKSIVDLEVNAREALIVGDGERQHTKEKLMSDPGIEPRSLFETQVYYYCTT